MESYRSLPEHECWAKNIQFFTVGSSKSHGQVKCFTARMGCEIGFVSMRIIPRSQSQEEEAAFLTGFCDYHQPIVSRDGVVKVPFFKALRDIFLALEMLHYGRGRPHSNLNDAASIVFQKKSNGFSVKLRGLKPPPSKEDLDEKTRKDCPDVDGLIKQRIKDAKTKDCEDLDVLIRKLITESMTVSSSATNTPAIPYVIDRLLKQLRKDGCLNLSESLFFIGAKSRLDYFLVAYKWVKELNFVRHLNVDFTRKGTFDWTREVRNHPVLGQLFRKSSYSTFPGCFLRFCRNACEHFPANINGHRYEYEKQWQMLYAVWPKFFDKLHGFLCHNKIYIFGLDGDRV
ncbi:unnamed protein product [Linum trigynum]|uniref:Uncharacterized protein n=1 Tax=Linum trigynum TaxID=586398 RepID=A0AAV2DUP1_9ROSI